ncbi:MAG: Fn3-like domain-containing protein [Clostridia bacterium]|nr:Fn3-like domain-containing protein [Clostridia bacterium]
MVKLKEDPVLQDPRAGDEGVNEEAAKLRPAQDEVIARINGVTWSPRLQGAGQADLLAACTTKAYIEVRGSARPKLELGDDDAKSGIFRMSFDIVNFGSAPLTYSLNANVQTEGVTPASLNGVDTYVMTGSPWDVTGNIGVALPSAVTVPAIGRKTVTVTVNVNPFKVELNERFPLGAYIEGFVRLDGTVDLSIPFLGFCGDWEYPAVLDRGCCYDEYLGASQYPAADVNGGGRADSIDALRILRMAMDLL